MYFSSFYSGLLKFVSFCNLLRCKSAAYFGETGKEAKALYDILLKGIKDILYSFGLTTWYIFFKSAVSVYSGISTSGQICLTSSSTDLSEMTLIWVRSWFLNKVKADSLALAVISPWWVLSDSSISSFYSSSYSFDARECKFDLLGD